MSDNYGPDAIATLANLVTVARILVSPLLFAMMAKHTVSWPVFIGWFLLCVTDGFDGYLARKMGTTRSGAFLDPLADKVLVLGAMFMLVSENVWWFLPVLLIAVREIAISMYRSYAGKLGISIPARYWAKVKTVVQQFAVAAAVWPWIANHSMAPSKILLWVSVALTLITGAQYLLDAGKAAREQKRS
jgi:CDP-diacylglycerol--glycerol-3-phosphate 3-phosphatidyltransferase